MNLKANPALAPIKFTSKGPIVGGKVDGNHQDDEFTLLVKPPSEIERMVIVDAAVSGSFEVVQRAVRGMVKGWVGVNVDNVPLVFDVMDSTGRTTGETRLGDLLASISLDLQFQIMGALLTFAGLDKYAERLLSALPALTGKGVDLDPTGKQPSDTLNPA